jgi:hypothetical protein
MSEGQLPHLTPARALVALMLFMATGPLCVWLVLRVRLPAHDPSMHRSAPALIEAPVL